MKKIIVSIISLFSLTVSAQPGRHIAAYTQFEQCKGGVNVYGIHLLIMIRIQC